jgi:hypothetical protein
LNKLEDYRKHAAECREMARTALPSHRQQLEQMAETWEQLAIARKRQLERQGQTVRTAPSAAACHGDGGRRDDKRWDVSDTT